MGEEALYKKSQKMKIAPRQIEYGQTFVQPRHSFTRYLTSSLFPGVVSEFLSFHARPAHLVQGVSTSAIGTIVMHHFELASSTPHPVRAYFVVGRDYS